MTVEGIRASAPAEHTSISMTKAGLLLAVALSTLAMTEVARAQEGEAAEIVQNEIVVTALRRDALLEDVPMSITAISTDRIEQAGVTSIHDLDRLVPGVKVTFNGFATQPAIRGVTSLTNGNGFDNNVAIYVDGFYSPDTVSINGDLANIAGIEVLKGPQGTLYGRNATGGAILIRTLAPADTLTVKADLSYARFNEMTVSGYVSAPVSDDVRFSVAGSSRVSDGYVDLIDPVIPGRTVGDAAPLKQQSIRTKLAFDITDTFRATLAYNYGYNSDARGLMFTSIAFSPPSIAEPPLRAKTPVTASYNRETFLRARNNEGTLTLELDTATGKLTSYTGYSKRAISQAFDFDGSYKELTFSDLHRMNWDTFQQAVDFTLSPIENLDLIVGGSYYWEDRAYDPNGIVTYQGLNVVVRTIAGTSTDAIALYASGTYKVTPSLSLTAGGRWTSEKRGVDMVSYNGAGAVIFAPTHKDETFRKFVPSASARLEVAPRSNVYASFSKGFRSGAWNLSVPPSPDLLLPIAPENITAYEVGFKTAQSNLHFDIAAFYYDYKDFQVTASGPNPLCGCGILIFVQNANSAKIYGVDGQLTWTPADRLNITVGGAYLHARYGDFPNATGTGLNAATGLNVNGQTQDWTDQQMARAPDFSGNIGVDYTVPLGGGSLRMAGNFYYTDSFVVSNPSLYGSLAGSLAGKQRYRQDNYISLDAQIGWTDPSDRVTFTVFGRNLTDENTFQAYSGATFGDYGVYAPPRVIGARASFRY